MHLSNFLKSLTTEAIWLGRLSYAKGLDVQSRYIERLKGLRETSEVTRNYLLLLEHDPVYTVGIRSHYYSEEEEKKLRQLGADFFRTNRGGLITFHGPGQLVAYPIFNLASQLVREDGERSLKVGVRRFVYLVEESIIRTLHKFGITAAARSPDTGVWVGDGTRKIAAIGISVKRGVTGHGLALNCNTDLKWFREIVPCGLVGKEVTSISAELGRNVSVTELMKPLSENFAEVFQCGLEFRDASGEVEKLVACG